MPTQPELPIVLIVEDSDEDFDTLMLAVRTAGIHADVRRATTGGECLELLRGPNSIRPAMIFMDLNTPGTDGREALATIKSDPALKAYPVIVFSTSANPKDLESCYRAGANAYHVKPVRHPHHLQVVTDLLHYWLVRAALPVTGGTK